MTAQPRRSFGKLLALSLGLVAMWLIIGLFNTSEFYRRTTAARWEEDWIDVLRYQLSFSLNWALFTPPVVFFAERIRLKRPATRRDVLTLAGKILLIIGFVAVVAFIRSIWGAAVQQLSEGVGVTWDFVLLTIRIRAHRHAFILVIIIGTVHLIEAYRKADATQRETFALQAALANDELAHFRLRLQPRFMTAVLQEIRSRLRVSPDEADALLVQVSRLLRRSIDFDRSGDVTLREELDFIDQYFGVEQLRLRGTLTAHVHVPDAALLDARVPPLLLQTLVCSAVMSSPGGGEIDVVAERLDGLSLHVRATRGAGSVDDDTLAEARIRLGQLFGGRAAITRERVAAGWITSITLPLRTDEEAAA